MSTSAQTSLSQNDFDAEDIESGASKDFLTVMLADQIFGIPVLQVQDVLRTQTMTRIPLAPPEVDGSLNLRGRIVTAIDMRRRLRLPPKETETGALKSMSVVVEHEGELYSLTIDQVGDVLTLYDKDYRPNPATLDATWRDVSEGIYRLEDRLLVVLDITRLLSQVHS